MPQDAQRWRAKLARALGMEIHERTTAAPGWLLGTVARVEHERQPGRADTRTLYHAGDCIMVAEGDIDAALARQAQALKRWYRKRVLGQRVYGPKPGTGGRPRFIKDADELIALTLQARKGHAGVPTEADLEEWIFGNENFGREIRRHLTLFGITWEELLDRTGGR
ncbi:MAG: hypothetical protein HY321_21105 [Armatimonadetes bacterium]|nr:hypothetical protein [Armatimonadota bacterium]